MAFHPIQNKHGTEHALDESQAELLLPMERQLVFNEQMAEEEHEHGQKSDVNDEVFEHDVHRQKKGMLPFFDAVRVISCRRMRKKDRLGDSNYDHS